jgi:hypothetical protein
LWDRADNSQTGCSDEEDSECGITVHEPRLDETE